MSRKNRNKIRLYYLTIFIILLSISTVLIAAEYTVPRAVYSVYAEDLDFDGDKDIVLGHKYNALTDWGGISILENIGKGVFTLTDSLFCTYGFAYVNGSLLVDNDYIDIFGEYISDAPEPINNRFIGIIYDFGDQGFGNISYYPLNTRISTTYATSGDIDNDNDIDIIVASNNGQFWGVMYNDGTGQFSTPEYHDVADYYPISIVCGNLNEDDRNDIAICAQKTEIFFSYESSFQCSTLEVNNFKNEINIADMDNDGDNDIAVLVDLYLIGYTGLTIYENNGNNSFYKHDEVIFQPTLGCFEISDINNDNLPDIICTGDNDGIYLLYNEGNFILSAPQYFYVANYGEYSRNSFCTDLDGNGLDGECAFQIPRKQKDFYVYVVALGKPMDGTNVNYTKGWEYNNTTKEWYYKLNESFFIGPHKGNPKWKNVTGAFLIDLEFWNATYSGWLWQVPEWMWGESLYFWDLKGSDRHIQIRFYPY